MSMEWIMCNTNMLICAAAMLQVESMSLKTLWLVAGLCWFAAAMFGSW